MNQEEIYDQQIAPLMSQIIEICKQNEINCHATFYLLQENDESEEPTRVWCTTHLPFNAPAGIRLMEYLATSRGNLDIFLTACIRDGELHGHESAFLQKLQMERDRTEDEH